MAQLLLAKRLWLVAVTLGILCTAGGAAAGRVSALHPAGAGAGAGEDAVRPSSQALLMTGGARQLLQVKHYEIVGWDRNAAKVRCLTSQCSTRLAWADGCSVAGIQYRPEVTPACNAHDICWRCCGTPGWGLSKASCNAKFLVLTNQRCDASFPGSLGAWNRGWCRATASLMKAGVDSAFATASCAKCSEWERFFTQNSWYLV